MATTTQTPGNTITEEDVNDVEELLSEMKTRANKANDDGNVTMLGVYAEMVKIISPKVSQLRERKEREDRADINRRHHEMRKARREAAEAAAAQQSA
jgi:hypothetical protein